MWTTQTETLLGAVCKNVCAEFGKTPGVEALGTAFKKLSPEEGRHFNGTTGRAVRAPSVAPFAPRRLSAGGSGGGSSAEFADRRLRKNLYGPWYGRAT